MKNFVEQISIKSGGFFTKSRWNWYKLYCLQAHQNIGRYSKGQISAVIQKVKYRPLMSVDRYVGRSDIQNSKGRYSKGQILADNIGGPIYRSIWYS